MPRNCLLVVSSCLIALTFLTRLSRSESLSEKNKTAHDDGSSIRIVGRSAISM